MSEQFVDPQYTTTSHFPFHRYDDKHKHHTKISYAYTTLYKLCGTEKFKSIWHHACARNLCVCAAAVAALASGTSSAVSACLKSSPASPARV